MKNHGSTRHYPLILIALLGLLVFANSMNGPFLLDDLSKIAGNPDIRSLTGIWRRLIYPYSEVQLLFRNDPSRPVVFLTYALNFAVSGLSSWSYHLFDTVVHIANSYIVFRLARQALAPLKDNRAEILSSIAALLFLLHPLNAGSVIYAYGRSDTLGALFALGTILLMSAQPLTATRVLLGLMTFSLALGCKQSYIAIPGFIFAWRLWIVKERKTDLGRSIAPFCSSGLFIC